MSYSGRSTFASDASFSAFATPSAVVTDVSTKPRWSRGKIALIVVVVCVVLVGIALGIYFGVTASGSTTPTPVPLTVTQPSGPDQDCVVEYSDWSSCSPSCGPGSQTRTGTIVTERQGNGRACSDLSQSRPCSTACPTSLLVNADQTFSIGPWPQSADEFTISFWVKLNKQVFPMNLLNTYSKRDTKAVDNAYGAIEIPDATTLRWRTFFSGNDYEFGMTNLDLTKPVLVTYGWKRFYALPSTAGNMFYAVNDTYKDHDKLVQISGVVVPNMEFFNTNGASGWIQDVRVYATRLTAGQVAEIYNNGKPDPKSLPSQADKLVMQYPLLDGFGKALIDTVTNKYLIVPEGAIGWQSQNIFLS